MPALLLHLTLAEQTLEQAGIPASISQAVRQWPGVYLLGSILPDLPYHAQLGRQLVRHLLKREYLHSPWGDVFHTRGTGTLPLAMLAHLRRSHLDPADAAQVLALAAGYLSHYAVDRLGHPMIQQLVAQHRGHEPAVVVHARLENYQSQFYHRDLLGHDIPATPFAARLVCRVAGCTLLTPALPAVTWEALRAACLQTHGRAPRPAEVRDWLRGIAGYGRLFSSRLGRMELPAGDPEQLRERWYQGPGVDLVAPLSRARRMTLTCWEAAAQLLSAERLTAEVQAAFLSCAPDIDLGMGA